MSLLSGPRVRSEDILAILRKHQTMKNFSDEDFSELVNAQMRTPGSAVREALSKYDVSLAAAVARSRILLPTMSIVLVLTASEKAMVRTVFPDRDFDFLDRERHDHALAATMRKIDRALLRERLDLTARVVDVGGDYVFNIQSSKDKMHSCCPVIDVKDKFREVERTAKLRGLLAGKTTPEETKNRVKEFFSSADEKLEWKCDKRAEECGYEADWLIATHVYDMTLEQMAAAMVSHRAGGVSGCLIFSPDMLECDQGKLPSVGGWYRIENNGGKIVYGTTGGSSWHYVHGMKELRRFASDCAFVHDNVLYIYRVTEVRGDTLYYEIWHAKPGAKVMDPAREAYTVSGGPWAEVDGYSYVAARGQTETGRVEACVVRYPWETWTKALEYARAQVSNNRFSLEDLGRSLRTMTARTTVNSVAVAGVPKIGEAEYAGFLVNVTLCALYAVEVERAGVSAAVGQIRARREPSWFLTRVFKRFYDLTLNMERAPLFFIYRAFAGFLRQLHAPRAKVVRFRYDDGSRVKHVTRCPGWAILLGIITGVPPFDESHADQARRRQVEMRDTADLLRVACAEDEEYSKVMKDVLEASFFAAGDAGEHDESLYGFTRDLSIATTTQAPSTERDSDSSSESDSDSSPGGDVGQRDPPGGAGRRETDSGTGGTKEDKTPFKGKAPMRPGNRRGGSYGAGSWGETSDGKCDTEDEGGEAATSDAGTISGHDPDAGVFEADPVKAAAKYGIRDIIDGDEVFTPNYNARAATAYYKLAMEEAIRLYKAENRRMLAECKSGYLKTTVNGVPVKGLVASRQGDCFKVDYYYTNGDDRLGEKSFRGVDISLFQYSAVFIPGKNARLVDCKLVDGRVEMTGSERYSGWVLVSDNTEIYNGPGIIAGIEAAVGHFDASQVEIVIRDGVPGCGKTTQILTGARYDDLILASGRANTEETRARKIKLDAESAAKARETGVPFVSFKNPERRIRTYDSYLMARVHERADVMHADECFMEHAGKLAAVIYHSGAQRVELHGDSKQVPYVNRHVEESCLFERLRHRHLHTYRYLSHRIALDAAAVVAPQYGFKIRTTNKVLKSFDLRSNVIMDSIMPEPGTKYVTFYQDDKASLKKRCKNTNTVAEVQGDTFESVVLARQQARAQALYNSWPHVTVAVSRHTKRCSVWSPSFTGSILERTVLFAIGDPEYCSQFADVSTVGKPTRIQNDFS